MKKFLITGMSTILAVSFLMTGCSGGSAQKKEPDTKQEAISPDIKAIKDKGVLKVGVKVDVPKFGYKDPKTGKIEGFEVDIVKAIAKKILGDENKVDLQGVTAKTRGPLLDNGEIDLVAATFTITEERKKSYNFSDPYFTDGVGLLVNKAAGFKSLKDLNGKKIGVAQSATTKKAIQEESAKQGLKVEFLEFGTYPEIKSALDAGRVDCFSVDTAILFGYLDDKTEILPDRFNPQSYGIASKKGNDGVAKVVNDTINELKSSGEMDKMLAKWGLKK